MGNFWKAADEEQTPPPSRSGFWNINPPGFIDIIYSSSKQLPAFSPALRSQHHSQLGHTSKRRKKPPSLTHPLPRRMNCGAERKVNPSSPSLYTPPLDCIYTASAIDQRLFPGRSENMWGGCWGCFRPTVTSNGQWRDLWTSRKHSLRSLSVWNDTCGSNSNTPRPGVKVNFSCHFTPKDRCRVCSRNARSLLKSSKYHSVEQKFRKFCPFWTKTIWDLCSFWIEQFEIYVHF